MTLSSCAFYRVVKKDEEERRDASRHLLIFPEAFKIAEYYFGRFHVLSSFVWTRLLCEKFHFVPTSRDLGKTRGKKKRDEREG